MSAMLIILILTACAAVPVLPAALDFDSLTPEQFDETIRNNPEAYENWLDCQNDKTKCEHSGKNLEVSDDEYDDEAALEELRKELGDDHSLGFLYNGSGLMIPGFNNETSPENKTVATPGSLTTQPNNTTSH
uniref:Peptide chain release factor 2 n=1 Tax=Lygus hesperus TaxID=30085 RepID=A0A0A9YLI1_LYGHE